METPQSQTLVHQSQDGIPFVLRETHDFTWLRGVGRVFRVFDRQDSGNLCFGIVRDGAGRGGGRRGFVKYAGARTVRYDGEPADAVARLKYAAEVNEALRHPCLVSLEEHFATPHGYAAVFEWCDGENLHPYWEFPPPAKYTHPDSPYRRFRGLPVARRVAAMDAILDFHCHVETLGFVAVDFYDGSIMYDFARDETKICDIDFHQRRPYRNPMGRMWGSQRFMSPEEFELGAPIDEGTNVFNMGAIAFGLLGGERDRAFAKWEAGRAFYEVALRAVRPDRAERWGSVREMREGWERARGR